MSLKAAKPSEAPITEWETYEGSTYGYTEDGYRAIEITAPVRATAWTVASNVRGWAAQQGNSQYDNWQMINGEANGLREAKKAALAALRAL